MLDTHFLVWLADNPKKIRKRERTVLDRSDLTIVASVISLWEIRTKRGSELRKRRPTSVPSPHEIIAFAAISDIAILPLSLEDYGVDLSVPIDHDDPFDEMLLVHAQQLGARLLTRDDHLVAHPLAMPL